MATNLFPGITHAIGKRPGFDDSAWTFFERHVAAICSRPGDLLNVSLEVRDVLVGNAKRGKAKKASGGMDKALSAKRASHAIKTKRKGNHLKKTTTKVQEKKKKKKGGDNIPEEHKAEEPRATPQARCVCPRLHPRGFLPSG